MARVKYTGEIPVLFHDLNRPPVRQNEEFEVPDSEKERYTRRNDIVDLDAPEPEPATEAAPAAEAGDSSTDTAPEAVPPTE